MDRFLFAINYMEGVHIDFERIVDWVTPKTDKDFKDLIARYQKFQKQAQGLVESLKEGVKQGKTYHAISMVSYYIGISAIFSLINALQEGVVDVLGKHADGDAKKTVFYECFDKIPDSIGEKADLQKSAAAAIKDSVQPGMKLIKDYLEKEYLKHTRKDIGITCIPEGKEFYANCIKYHTSTNMTPQEIHDVGLKEVERIEGEMKKIVAELGHKDMPLDKFIEQLRNDPKMYCDTPEELMAGFRKLVNDVILPKIPQIFTTAPKSKLE